MNCWTGTRAVHVDMPCIYQNRSAVSRRVCRILTHARIANIGGPPREVEKKGRMKSNSQPWIRLLALIVLCLGYQLNTHAREQVLLDFKADSMPPKEWNAEGYAFGTHQPIEPCTVNEPCLVNMRTVMYETERKCSRVGNSPSAGMEVTVGRQENRRGGQNRGRFQIFRRAMEARREKGRSEGVESQTAPGTEAPSESETDPPVVEGTLGRTAESGLSYRPLDLSAGSRGNRQEVPRDVPSGSRVEDSPRVRVDTPEARATGPRTRRKSHPLLARGELAANKKGAKRKLVPIVFLDESGFMLQPVRRRTWAPSGKTPQQDAWDRHDRLSVIGLIGVSPLRHRLSLYFTFQSENFQTEHMICLLRQLHYHYRSQVILVWDRLRAHLSAATYFEAHRLDWFQFEWLPAYAPELNPTHTKYATCQTSFPTTSTISEPPSANRCSNSVKTKHFFVRSLLLPNCLCKGDH